jgi:hypothetical protein
MYDPYAKFQDKYLFEQPKKDKATQALFDSATQDEADRIVERFRSRPVYLKEVALKLAKEVLQSQEDNKQDDFQI